MVIVLSLKGKGVYSYIIPRSEKKYYFQIDFMNLEIFNLRSENLRGFYFNFLSRYVSWCLCILVPCSLTSSLIDLVFTLNFINLASESRTASNLSGNY